MSEVLITVREGQGYISGVPDEVTEPLMLATSFRPEGYQYTTLFQRGKTDGRVKLLKRSKFPAGLLSHVVRVLDKHKVEYTLEVEPYADDKPSLQLGTVGLESRYYQDDAVEAGVLNPRGIIQAPTGSGKTAIGCRIIAMRGKWALVVVPTIDLLHQYKSFLEEHLVPEGLAGSILGNTGLWRIGQLGDGVVDPQPVTVATARTAAKALNVAYEKYEYGEYDDKDDTKVKPGELREWIAKIGLVIVEEAHILGAQTTYDLTVKIPAPCKLGFSASPWRDDGADLMIEAATGPKIYTITASELVASGHLVPPIIRVVKTAGWWQPAAWGTTCRRCGRQRRMTATGPAERCECGAEGMWKSEFTDAYNAEIVNNAIRNGMIAHQVQQLEGPTLVLVKQVKHGRLLEQMIPGSRFLSGKDKGSERVQAFQDMREGRLLVLVATTIADLGLDIPILRNLVLAAGGKSSTRHLQRIGRVARTYPGKDHALVVDYDDSHVHRWFRNQEQARRKIEKREWGDAALWI
jgi:superfamily II DNA or RNA helicase